MQTVPTGCRSVAGGELVRLLAHHQRSYGSPDPSDANRCRIPFSPPDFALSRHSQCPARKLLGHTPQSRMPFPKLLTARLDSETARIESPERDQPIYDLLSQLRRK